MHGKCSYISRYKGDEKCISNGFWCFISLPTFEPISICCIGILPKMGELWLFLSCKYVGKNLDDTKMFYSKRNKMLLSGYWHKYWRTRENVLVIECIYLQILFRLSMKSIQYCILSLPNIWNYTCTNIFIMGIINLERK